MDLLLLTLLLTPLVLGSGQEDVQPQVETQYGKLRGKILSVKETSKKVHGFYGVPFAKPPVGSLRFASPEPPESWSFVREAQEHAALCLQSLRVLEQMARVFKTSPALPPLSEDCLYLNIFTPADREKDTKLPVMVFIHGGGLRSGRSRDV
ncbi:unnamed protein product [Ranitomeya imitator]|uniref:Carboxylesterase type B domain-containing protein n=1 Tax=Ranitomeya imitator TaxID=111125 RepID=A0ABN9MG74_9NEOB|nr:unnamed protein product [Ranitomeya imitator]